MRLEACLCDEVVRVGTAFVLLVGKAMAGPACEVLLEGIDGGLLDALDELLSSIAERVDRTRKGRVWDVWIGGRPFHVCVEDSPAAIGLSAGCNGREDRALLDDLSQSIVARFGGMTSAPEK